MTRDLGRLEALILLVVGLLGDHEPYGIVPRAKATRMVLYALRKCGELHSTENSFKTSLSRAVLSLCEKGLLRGYYRAWYEYRDWNGSAEVFAGEGSKPFANFDDKRPKQPGRVRPRLLYLKVSDKGSEVLPTSQEVNEWIERLGWREETAS